MNGQALAVLVELEHGQLIGCGRVGGYRLVEGAFGLAATVELADQIGAGEE